VQLQQQVPERRALAAPGNSSNKRMPCKIDGLKELCRQATTDEETLTIAAAESVLEGLIYARFTRMRELLPRHHFVFYSAPTDEVVQRLKSGRADLGVLRESAVTADLRTLPLTEIAYCLVILRAMLPEGSAHGLDALRGLRIAMLRGDGEFTRTLLTLCSEAQITLRPTVEASTFAGLRDLVQTGSVAAFLPDWMGKSLARDRYATIAGEEFKCLSRNIVVAAHRQTIAVRPNLEDVAEQLTTVWRP
jgi:DNA-binding transcriptional LysR family regulator